MGINEDSFTKLFTIAVQFGAIISVLVIYWRRFLLDWTFYKKLFVACLPAGLLGVLVAKKIDAILGNVTVVACSLIIGGIILILFEYWMGQAKTHHRKIEDLSLVDSFRIGVAQCLAFIPGVSRSAASIIGGLSHRMSRSAAAEFSFFIGVPTLAGATLLKLLKGASQLTGDQIQLLLVGNVVSFFVGVLAIRGFVAFLVRRGFTVFGVYRIVVGIVILVLHYWGPGLRMD